MNSPPTPAGLATKDAAHATDLSAGLTDAAVSRRGKIFGRNEVAEHREHPLLLFAKKF